MIRIVVSAITDIRAIEALLKSRDVAYEIDQRSMGSADARQAFSTMKAEHQWTSLPMIFVDETFLGGEPELRVYLNSTRNDSPVMAWLLGVGGLLPFVALGLAAIADIPLPGMSAGSAVLAYAATILSFIGAVHWGLAIEESDAPTRNRLFTASVMPALVAWVALLLPTQSALSVFIVGFAGWYLWERTTIWQLYPRWFAQLRTLLSAVVVLILVCVAALA
ncbi:MAG: DUF3429 family protein [Pseudomonadota bacterium]